MNTGGPAFPVPDSHQFNGHPGMTLLDWMAGNEELSDWDIEGAIIPDKLAKHFGGDMPKGGWSENPVAAFERDARIRAGMKYTRASAMLAEKARREADHSGDANKMVPDPFAETTLRRLTADVLPTGIKDAANDQLPSWCAEQVRARVNALEASNRELVKFAERIAAFPLEDFGWEKRADAQPLHGWNDYTLYVSDIKRARNLAAKAKGGA